MIWLVLGVLLWAGVHLMPAAAPGLKSRLQAKLGGGPYKGLFALGILAAVALIILGWRSAPPVDIFEPPSWARHLGLALLLVVIFLLVAASGSSRIKQFIRHPQLTGVVLWGLVHLLMNGDARSAVLFAGMSLWALVEIPLINRRDGPWQKPAIPSLAVELRNLVIAVVVYTGLGFGHVYFTGVAVLTF